MKKRIIATVILAVLSATFMIGCSGKKDGEFIIGIGQFAEHGYLDNCREGFIAGLEEEGYKEGVNLKILYENSQADANMASQISKNLCKGRFNMCYSHTYGHESNFWATKNTTKSRNLYSGYGSYQVSLLKRTGHPMEIQPVPVTNCPSKSNWK